MGIAISTTEVRQGPVTGSSKELCCLAWMQVMLASGGFLRHGGVVTLETMVPDRSFGPDLLLLRRFL